MRNYLLLFKLQLLSLFGINKAMHSNQKNGKSKLVKTTVLSVFVVVLFFGLATFYNWMFALVIKEAGLSFTLLIGAVFAASSIITFFTTIYKTNGTVFGFKDYDIIMSLPIKKSVVIASKITFLYLLSFASTFVIMLPAGIFYAINVKVNAAFFISYIIIMFFVPIIPMAIGLYIGAIIAYITSRFKRANFLTIIFYFIFLFVVMSFSYSSGANGEQQYLDLLNSMNKFYPLTKFFANAINTPNYLHQFIFIAVSAALFFVLVHLLSLGFERINTAILTKKTGAKYNFNKTKQFSAVRALFIKEFKKFLSIPMYVLNSAVGAVLAVIAGVFALIKMQTIAPVFSELTQIFPQAIFFVPLLLCYFVTMTTTTTCAISLEGKSFWIIKSSPVNASQVLLSKLLVNNIVILPAALLSSILVGIAISASVTYYVFSALFLSSSALFISAIGLLINLKSYKLEWDSEIKVIKQSMPVLLTMLVGMLFTAICGVGLYFLYNLTGVVGAFVVCVFSLLLCAVVHYILFTKGINWFNKI